MPGQPAASAASTSSREMPSRYRTASRCGTLTEASAAARTAGLALKAMPRPAAAIMSRSLAPSPTATVWLSGTPASAANRRSAAAFPARSMTGPGDPPGERAAGDLQRVRGGVVEPEFFRQRVGELGEPAADHAAPVAEPLQRPDQRARARGQPQPGPDRLQVGRVQPGQQRDPLPQRRGEVELAAHGRRGQRGHLVRRSRPARPAGR